MPSRSGHLFRIFLIVKVSVFGVPESFGVWVADIEGSKESEKNLQDSLQMPWLSRATVLWYSVWFGNDLLIVSALIFEGHTFVTIAQ